MVKEVIDNYISLQEIDNKVRDIEVKLLSFPKVRSDIENAIMSATKALDMHDKAFNELKSKYKDIVSLIDEQSRMLDSSQNKMLSVKNTKEYQASLKEIESLKKKLNDNVSTKEELSKKISDSSDMIVNLKKDIEDKEASGKKVRDDLLSEESSLSLELNILKDNRSAVILKVTPQNVSKYEKIKKARNGLAIVPIDGEVCKGCFMKIPHQMAINIKKQLDIYQCPHCQRFLYDKHKDGDISTEG